MKLFHFDRGRHAVVGEARTPVPECPEAPGKQRARAGRESLIHQDTAHSEAPRGTVWTCVRTEQKPQEGYHWFRLQALLPRHTVPVPALSSFQDPLPRSPGRSRVPLLWYPVQLLQEAKYEKDQRIFAGHVENVSEKCHFLERTP